MNRQRIRQSPWSTLILALAALISAVIVLQACRNNTPAEDGGTPAAGEIITEPIPITDVEVTVGDDTPAQVSVHVVGTLANACIEAREPEISRDGDTITVRIIGEQPTDVACAQVIREYEETIALGEFQPGNYTLIVNDVTTMFTVPA